MDYVVVRKGLTAAFVPRWHSLELSGVDSSGKPMDLTLSNEELLIVLQVASKFSPPSEILMDDDVSQVANADGMFVRDPTTAAPTWYRVMLVPTPYGFVPEGSQFIQKDAR